MGNLWGKCRRWWNNTAGVTWPGVARFLPWSATGSLSGSSWWNSRPASQVQEFFASPEYLDLVPLREQSTTTRAIIVEGYET